MFTLQSLAFAEVNLTAQNIQKMETKARAGDTEAQLKITSIYAQGQGVKQDYKKALYYSELAAKQGHKYAQKELMALKKKQ